MGDRALIQFKASDGEVSPAIYCHWAGHEVPAILVKLFVQMHRRPEDLQYIAARCIQQVIGGDTSDTGIGIWNADKELTAADTHGDAGVFVVEVGQRWKIANYTRREFQYPSHPLIDWEARRS